MEDQNQSGAALPSHVLFGDSVQALQRRYRLDYANAKKLQDDLPRWRPIDTAPKDGTEILVWNGKTAVAARWGCSHDGDYNNPTWEPSHVGALWKGDVTHWMPFFPPNTEGLASPAEGEQPKL